MTEVAASIAVEIVQERARQDMRWGEQNHRDGTGGEMVDILVDIRAVVADAERRGTLTWSHILREEVAEALAETYPDRLRTELIQVAAVAAAWIEAIDRRTGKDTSHAEANRAKRRTGQPRGRRSSGRARAGRKHPR